MAHNDIFKRRGQILTPVILESYKSHLDKKYYNIFFVVSDVDVAAGLVNYV